MNSTLRIRHDLNQLPNSMLITYLPYSIGLRWILPEFALKYSGIYADIYFRKFLPEFRSQLTSVKFGVKLLRLTGGGDWCAKFRF